MSNKEKATKISWLTLAFMAFSTVWGFGNITNGFVYFNGPQVIFSWIFMFVLYFIPYALMVGELGSAFKNEGGGVSSWLHQTTNAKLAYYAGWTYWACHITYIASKGSGFLKALSWAIFRNAETYDSFPTRYIQLATFCILLLGCYIASLGLNPLKKLLTAAGTCTFVMSLLYIVMMFAAPAINPTAEYVHANLSFSSLIPNFNVTYFTSLSILVFAVGGCEKISPYVNKVENPSKGFPRGMIALAVMVVTCAILGTLAMSRMFDPAVINASAYGAIRAGLDADCITKVYGASHGIVGVLNDELFVMDEEDPAELELLKYTPSSALGSCRYKIADPDADDTDYKRILEIFKKYDVRYFFYNGGNDSMDTCNKISKYMQKVGYPCRIMGIPKTIDNDLFGTDHCPGFPSAAKYIATSISEVYLDSHVYDKGQITIVEIMGRHAGWLAGAAALAKLTGCGPDLIYLPEVDFNMEEFLADVSDIYAKNKNCIVAVSEGIHYPDGTFVSEAKTSATDGFGHAQLGGLAALLANVVKEKTGAKVRGIELSLLQRCGAHVASGTDIAESYLAGKTAIAVTPSCWISAPWPTTKKRCLWSGSTNGATTSPTSSSATPCPSSKERPAWSRKTACRALQN